LSPAVTCVRHFTWPLARSIATTASAPSAGASV
jgi:hypothetical protein